MTIQLAVGPISALREEYRVRWDFFEQNHQSLEWRLPLMIVDAEGRSVGYLIIPEIPEEASLYVQEIMLEPGVSWRAVMPSVLRGLKAKAQDMRSLKGETLERLIFVLGDSHPARRAVPGHGQLP